MVDKLLVALWHAMRWPGPYNALCEVPVARAPNTSLLISRSSTFRRIKSRTSLKPRPVIRAARD